ncbi:DMT family transporter [Shimia biformata]|uniref:DMT family transporter n=1 Tax=Shimia biformata TaxID=1294299 RepID=UPI0019519FAF|nr:DMT family transporter [Shimia biformata]
MNNLHSILLMTFSMFCFGVEDFMIKHMAASLPPGQVLLMLGFGGAVIFAAIAKARGQALFPTGAGTGMLYLRSALEGMLAICMVLGLWLVPLSVFATVLQTSPLMLTMGAALFLGETVGWRRWAAISVGFFGILLIIRPGTTGFDPATLLVLAATVLISARDLISRRLPKSVPSLTVAFQGFAALVISGPLLMLVMGTALVPATAGQTAGMATTVLFGVMGYFAIVVSTRIGDAVALAPFRYTRMVFALILGIVILGERPEMLTYLGAGLIIASGLYTYLRERRIAMQMTEAPLQPNC